MVYLAVDPALNRQVALKIISSDDQEMVERFQREAQAAAKLKHPNIAQVYEAGSVGNRHYFTMDYIDGHSLDRFISGDKRFGLDEFARVMMQTARALDYAHQQNIIHRDIKPGNIMIDRADKVYLTDFGLAKQLTGLDRSLTMTGTTIGTPEYMSPEQVMGMKDELDRRSDVFSLGATFYHCITNRTPFDGKEVYEVFSKIINYDPPPPGTVIRIIPKDLETICLKCLEKDKSRRYQTAKELADDIERYLNNEPIMATRSGYLSKLWRRARKNKAASLGIASAALIALAVVVGLVVSSGQARIRAKAKVVLDRAASVQTAEEKIRIAREALEIDQTFGEACQTIGYAYKAKAAEGRYNFNQYRELYWDAYKNFSKAIEVSPTLVYSYYERAVIMSDIFKRPKEAIADFEKVIQLDPDSYMGYFAKGNIAVDQKHNDEAIAYYTKVLELFPKHDSAYLNRGVAYLNKRDEAIKLGSAGTEYIDRAMTDLNAAVSLNQADAMAYFNRGILYGLKEDFDRAIADYTQAIQINPDFLSPYINRGNLYKQSGQTEKAFTDYNVALRIDPQSVEAHYNRADMFFIKGQTDEALADYNEAIRLDPTYIKAYYNRGNIHDTKGDTELAIRDFTTVIKLDPGYADAYFNRGILYGKQGKSDEAIADYSAVIKLKPDYVEAYVNRGIIYSSMGEIDKAMSDYERVIKINPGKAETYVNRGNVYNRQGDFNRAVADYTQAITLDPKLPQSYHCRAMAYANHGDYELAIADAQQLLKLQPNSPLAMGIKMLVNTWRWELKAKQNPPEPEQEKE